MARRLKRCAGALAGSVVVLALCAGCGKAPPPGVVSATPGEIDFGVVRDKPVPFHRAHIRIANRTVRDHMVADVEASDHLKFEMASGIIVPAGGDGEGVVTLDARGATGDFNGEVVIRWASDDAPIRIPVHAKVEKGVIRQAAGPNVAVIGPRDWDFGTIQRQAVKFFDFTVKNTGEQPLIFESVETHCGCVQAWPLKNRLVPGEETKIRARVTAHVYPGTRPRKTITVETNDPDTPVLTFQVYGHIQDTFTIEPSPVDFGELPRGEGGTLTVRVHRNVPDVPKATAIDILSTVMGLKRLPDEEQGDVVAAAEISVPADAPSGTFETELTVKFGLEDRGIADLTVPVRGSVEGGLPVVPALVNLGLVEVGHSVTRVLRIPDIPDYRTIEVQCEMNYLSAKVEPEGTGARILLTYAPEFGEGTVVGRALITDRASDRGRAVPVAAKFARQSRGDEADTEHHH